MNGRRALALLASFGACGVALIVSCTFPDVQFTNGAGEGGPGTDSGGPDSPDSPSGSDGSLDASIIEAATRDGGETKVDASGCTSCDCDNDGFFRRGGGDAGCDGGPGDVYDCDDTDVFLNPKQGFVSDTKWSSDYTKVYDWNCSGTVEMAYPTGLTCGGTAITGCTGGQGYVGAGPGCGQSQAYYGCQVTGGVGCGPVMIDVRVQLCK